VEFIERMAFLEGSKKNVQACQTKNSDGFAGFPSAAHDASRIAQRNAFAEAIERFVWSTWWDSYSACKMEKFKLFDFKNTLVKDLLEIINEHTPVKTIYRIIPTVLNSDGIQTIIFFVKLEYGGFISGGAAGDVDNNKFSTSFIDIQFRALAEMVRHSIGYRRSLEKKLIPETLYEKRLLYFASGEGDQLVEDRLNIFSNSNKRDPIILPELIYDSVIPHEFSEAVVVHRCLFNNQPPFVGGSVARLCL
jgi:hypothetical protein